MRTSHLGAERLDEFRWRLPKQGGMRVPGLLFADRALLERMMADRTPEQVRNAAHLPGILEASIAMPDAHWGYGLPVGGVVATHPDEGVVSPGAVGYDIGCGVRLLRCRLTRARVAPVVEALADDLYRTVPCGVGSSGAVRVGRDELDRVLRHGARWAVERGDGVASDLEHCEEGGALADADPRAVSDAAHERGRGQLGTLGSGNHFLEVQEVDQVLDPDGASALGLALGDVTVMIHCGSRGLGHQVCTDHVREVSRRLGGWGITLPDRQLACAPPPTSRGRTGSASARACAGCSSASSAVPDSMRA